MINDVEIERVTEIKFLGVTIDNKLCWKLYINYINVKYQNKLQYYIKPKIF